MAHRTVKWFLAILTAWMTVNLFFTASTLAANTTKLNTSKTQIICVKKTKYTYNQMTKDMKALCKKYPDILSYQSLGKSYDNRSIYEITLGKPTAKKHVLIQASIHGREYINTLLVMRQVENYCINYSTGVYNGQTLSDLSEQVCFHILPMTNPDGVSISQFGANGIRDTKLRKKVAALPKTYGTYRRWRANARGVDLNRNYPLNWKRTKSGTRSSEGCKGSSAGSEKETKILMSRVKTLKPNAVISYHSAGSVIYWNFHQSGALQKRFQSLYQTIHSKTGYSATPVGTLRGCFGDWVAADRKTPTLTIETGRTSSPADCPVPGSQFSTIWKENRYVLPALAHWQRKNP